MRSVACLSDDAKADIDVVRETSLQAFETRQVKQASLSLVSPASEQLKLD